MSFFDQGMDARRYARSRPFIHPTAIQKFRTVANIKTPLARALDVACGTGLSTVVLTDIVREVIGIDSSRDMLQYATRHLQVAYSQAAAEAMPFSDGQFDLVTAAQAYHWFAHDAFLSESHRVLRAQGWVVVYTSWFTGEMKDEPRFADWFMNEYLQRFPTPPRDRNPITAGLADAHNFAFGGEQQFRNEIAMSCARFTDYQLSTTNIIAAVGNGASTYLDAERWIQQGLAPFYTQAPERVFLFRGTIWYMKKMVASK
jgi:ubiquinone/menaquinone biosynthesis C-methylase UbiE